MRNFLKTETTMIERLLLLTLALGACACGASPTEPASPEPGGSIAAVAPEPTPPLVPPVPPATPTPAPIPAPPPPIPAPLARYAATVDSAHWYLAPLFGDTFEVWRYNGFVEVETGSRPWDRLPLLFDSPTQFIAGRNNGRDEKLVVRDAGGGLWLFEFNGVAGYAFGRMREVR